MKTVILKSKTQDNSVHNVNSVYAKIKDVLEEVIGKA